MKFSKILVSLLVTLLILGGYVMQADASNLEYWSSSTYIESDGTMHVPSLFINGVEKSSWGSVVSPMTDETGYVNPTDAGNYIRMYDAGYIRVGDATNTGDYYILFQSDSDAWQIGNDDGTDDFIVCHGGTMGTDNRIAVDDSATVTKITIGDATEYDMQFIFDGNEQNYSIGSDDTTNSFVIAVGDALGTSNALMLDANSKLTTYGDIVMTGTTPTLTIGDAGAEDVQLMFDGHSGGTDWHISLDDSADELEIGVGTTVDTTPAITIASATQVVTFYADALITGTTPMLTVGDGDAEDNSVYFNGVTDFSAGVDHSASKYVICNASTLEASTAALTIDVNEDITLPVGSLYIVDDEKIILGTGSDWSVEYDEAVDNQLIFLTAGTTAIADGDPMFEIITGASMDADQEVFGVSKGTQASNTALFTVDEDGDIVVTGTSTLTGNVTLIGDLDIDGDGLTSDGDLLITPGGDEVHINGGLDVGGTSNVGDNNLAVGGTSAFTGTVTCTGAIVANGAVTLGNAVTDVVTITGKVAGATPISFDGTTADAHYTILAVADAASSSKTVTLPSITSSIALETVATTAITANTTATITVVPGTDTLYTYTIDTDNEDCTLTFSAGGTAGDVATIIFITDGVATHDEVMTFEGTLAMSEGTLTLENEAVRYVVQFISDGTVWCETSRTVKLP